MNADSLDLLEPFVGKSYAKQAVESLKNREKQFRSLLSQRSVPQRGWDSTTLQLFLWKVSAMDSNNFSGNAGAGEREGRVFCAEVRRRHYGLSHGMGRSGDIGAVQPKAAGSSLICQLTRSMVRSLIKKDIPAIGDCIVLPVATGMAIVLTLLALKATRPTAKYVIWPRMDQKTCLKAILTAGFLPIIVEPICGESSFDELRTDLQRIDSLLGDSFSAASVLCVLTTASCFAPRAPDDVLAVARVCDARGVAHVVNNAYGLMSIDTCALLKKAFANGRVDAVVQSTDKNFMVPVGGSLVFADRKHAAIVEAVSQLYPGRGSVSAILDLFCTLLKMGTDTWTQLRIAQKQNLRYLKQQLAQHFADECVLSTPTNPISVALSLTATQRHTGFSDEQLSRLGSMLFTRNVSGARVFVRGKAKTIGPFHFANYGSHCERGYHCPYINIASAIGMQREEIDQIILRMKRCISQMRKSATAKVRTSVSLKPLDTCAEVKGEISTESTREPVNVNTSVVTKAKMKKKKKTKKPKTAPKLGSEHRIAITAAVSMGFIAGVICALLFRERVGMDYRKKK